ncbi:hypothetical protein CHM34_14870 [Paludifilum halophilum]|uniref:M23ase beta-sheet core domain-containing protein n=2 Tax=Paludifilum halophilum TaxID=1642702 RepID=A0A235B5I2_9BACL|nr:hypothetical protein CHM34_14870 [Paludifilum halophilum]
MALRSYFKVKHLPRRGPRKRWRYRLSLLLYTVLSAYFGLAVLAAWSGYFYDGKPVRLQFPLKDGVYYTGHGGNATVINYHNAYPPQAFALDIVRLNRFGTRAAGLAPDEWERFVIYGDVIYSPCTGKVTEAKDGLKQMVPFEMGEKTQEYRKKHAAGNHVIIRCQGVDILMAHMIPGSVAVKKGEPVEVGDPIGKVGNSGNTSEPHLHIHAERDGKGVPMTFEDRFLKRNSLMFSE